MIRSLDYKWQTLMVVAVGTFMVVLDTTIVNIALPKIITVFGSSVDQAQLVLTGYMLALAVIMPTTAYLTQTFGNKRVYLFTLTMFTLGSMLCGMAWSVPMLVVSRVLQGLGGGMIQPLGMALLFSVSPPRERGKMMGIYALPVMVAPIAGPTLGGYLVEYVDWRWVFYLNAPFGALGVLLGILMLRESPIRRGMRFDLVGFLLAAVCSSAALLAATDAPDKGWSDNSVVLKLIVAGLTAPIFVWWELRARQPLLNLRLFAIPAFALAGLVNFITSSALFGALFLLPVFLQNLRGLGAMETGLLLMPQALAMVPAVTLGGRISDRVGPRPLIVSGLIILALSTWLLARIDISTPDSTIRVVLVLRGISIGLAMMPAITAWLAAAPPSQTQAASALNNVLRQLYGAFATAAFASILQSRITFHQAMLSMAVSPDSPAVTKIVAQAQQAALARGADLAQAKTQLIAQLAGQVRMAAAVRSFDDCFLVAAVVCLLGLLPALFMRKPAAQAAHGPIEA